MGVDGVTFSGAFVGRRRGTPHIDVLSDVLADPCQVSPGSSGAAFSFTALVRSTTRAAGWYCIQVARPRRRTAPSSPSTCTQQLVQVRSSDAVRVPSARVYR
jgi:hypothetical protein